MIRVKVEDINMRFDSMVIFLFKRTFALLLVGIVFGFILVITGQISNPSLPKTPKIHDGRTPVLTTR